MKIYVAFKAPKTIRKFLLKFFSEFSYWGNPKAVETYKDKECKKVQCTQGRSRSIQDMYDLIQTYYPNTTLKTVLAELIKLRPKGYNIFLSRCCTINRPVMCFSEHKMHSLPKNSKAEWSWGRLLREELGIKNIQELYNYK